VKRSGIPSGGQEFKTRVAAKCHGNSYVSVTSVEEPNRAIRIPGKALAFVWILRYRAGMANGSTPPPTPGPPRSEESKVPTTVAEWEELLKQAPEADLMSEAARRSRARARNKPKVMRPCGMCGEMFGAKELRYHLPRCPKGNAV